MPAWIGRLFSHVVGLFVGALGMAVVLYTVFLIVPHPPRWAFAAVAAALALVAAGLVPVELAGSPWRVPQSWTRLGGYGYPAAFGVALGVGLATRLSSPGMYALVAWATVVPGWTGIWPVFAGYAAGRALPFLVVAVLSARRHTYAADQVPAVSRATRSLAAAEVFVLGLVAVATLGAGIAG